MEQLLLILYLQSTIQSIFVYGVSVSYELMYDNLDPSAIRNQTFKNSNYFGIISQ